MNDFTSEIYYKECESVANYIVERAIDDLRYNNEVIDTDHIRDRIFEDILHECIDEHRYVTYYAYHLPVLQFSGNAEYGINDFGTDWIADILKKDGLNGLHAALAFWAFYADVIEYIDQEIEGAIEEIENSQDWQ